MDPMPRYQQTRQRAAPSLVTVLTAMLVVLISGCTQESLDRRSDKAERGDVGEKLAENLITARDKNGNPTEVVGLTKNEKLQADGVFDTSFLPSPEAVKEKVFEFKKPEGYDADFSEPVLVMGNYLSPLLDFEDCAVKKYQLAEPSFEDIFRVSRSQNICGSVGIDFCIRLTSQNSGDGIVYLKTPSVKMKLFCPGETTASTKIFINEGKAATANATVDLHFTGTSLLTHMYVTNLPGCQTGGTWEPIAAKKTAWTLAPHAGQAMVYVAFRDLTSVESSCLSASVGVDVPPIVIPDTQAPSATSIAINAGAAVTASSSVTLNLAATGATAMFLSNTAGCGAGGAWEGYTATKTDWLLEQTNGLATVYAKFRDAAGNESTCIADTITHDSQAPTSGTIAISAGAVATSASTVTLGLFAVGASDMFVTNDATCSAGGAWEAYGTVKAAWPLAQNNALASVYVKFRDAVFNETLCLSDTILHDNQPPSGPSSFNDGTGALSAAVSAPLSWAAASDSGSGVASYQLALGSSAGDTDLQNWTDVGNNLTALVSGLSLTKGTYYASVRAVDQAGNVGPQVDGDGFTYGLWYQQAYLKAGNSEGNDKFGHRLALFGDTLAVTASGEDSGEATITNGSTASTDNSSPDTGAIYLFKRSAVSWAQEAYLKASNNGPGKAGIGFGESLALSADRLAVGAPTEDSNQTTITNGITASTDTSVADSGAVYIYARTASSWLQEAYLKAVNREASDQFGLTVSLSADTLAVGAPYEDSGETTITHGSTASTDNSLSGSGAVYVYRRAAGNWGQEAYFKAVNNDGGWVHGTLGPMPDDNYGIALGLDGDTLAVGSPEEDSSQTTITNGTTASNNNSYESVGAVYVYVRNGTTWTQQAYIKNLTMTDYQGFGKPLSLSADTLAVGVTFHQGAETTVTNNATSSAGFGGPPRSGAVYAYVRNAGNWVQQSYIKPGNISMQDFFGSTVAVSGDTLAVGAYGEDSTQASITNGTGVATTETVTNSGAAYVFKRTAGSWAPEAFLKASNRDNNDQFGQQIALHADTVAVGVSAEASNQTTITNGPTASSDNSSASAGAVYIFAR